jgi:hypothetical protein
MLVAWFRSPDIAGADVMFAALIDVARLDLESLSFAFP